MNIRLRHVLAACIPLFGCGPMEPMPVQRRSVPVSVVARRPDAPELKRLEKGNYYVRKPWTVELDGKRWVVPRGYHCNGITAPKALKQSLGDGVDRPETWAAIFHDWLFTQKDMSRSKADKLFYELLIAYGVPERKAGVMFATVSAYSLSKKFR